MVVTNNCNFDLYRPKNGDFSEIFSEIPAFIEPASSEIIAMYDDGVGSWQLFNIFTDFENVEIGDKIVIKNEDYIVRGVKKFESIIWKHSEIIVRKTL